MTSDVDGDGTSDLLVGAPGHGRRCRIRGSRVRCESSADGRAAQRRARSTQLVGVFPGGVRVVDHERRGHHRRRTAGVRGFAAALGFVSSVR
ncbi:MAG: FG-GAP repeat protein [Planctomycetes bacterium]|nr:FG-GAP repeat protein [Planctomycetota bacterium]